MTPKKDRTGVRLGRLVFIVETGERANKGSLVWFAKCDCGKVIKTIYGRRKSCGCLTEELNESRRNSKEWGEKTKAKVAAAKKVKKVKAKKQTEKVSVKTFDRLEYCTRYNHTFLCDHYLQCLDDGSERKAQLAKGNCYRAGESQKTFETNNDRAMLRVCEMVA